MKITPIETNHIRLDGGSMFGNTPKNLWQRWAKPDEQNRILLSCRCLLAKTKKGQNILFDVGTGDFFEPKLKERYGIEEEGLLQKSLEQEGLSENDIDAVILSHLHFDHAGGLLSAYNDGPPRLLFPRAKYFVGKEHWQRALSPHLREKASFLPHLHALLQKSGRLHFLEGPTHPDLDIGLSFEFAYGHTVGLVIAWLETDDGPVVFPADTLVGAPWMHLPVSMGYDRFAELAIEEKSCLLQKVVDRQAKIVFCHDPETALTRIKRHKTGVFSI